MAESEESKDVRAREPRLAPLAEARPLALEKLGLTWQDPYAWLRRRDEESVRAYLEAENAYCEYWLEDSKPLAEAIYGEIVGRLQEDDTTVPFRRDEFFYYERTVKGGQYPMLCRRHGEAGEERVLLDPNALSLGGYLAVRAMTPSPDHRLLGYAVDEKGDERYSLRVKDLDSGELLGLGPGLHDLAPTMAWSSDGRTLFYVELDAASRPFRVRRHTLGQADTVADPVVFEEADERFFVELAPTRSRRFIRLTLGSHTTSELHVLDADAPELPPFLLAGRQQDVELRFDHHGDFFYILSNEGALNFRLLRAPVADPRRESWAQILPHDPEIELLGLDLFAGHLALYDRHLGLRGIRILDLDGGEWHRIAFDEAVYTVFAEGNAEFETGTLRFQYSSPLTPPSVYDYDLVSRGRRLLKRTVVKGDFDPSLYTTERAYATAADGAAIPLSLVYRRDLVRDGSAPLLLYGYGSYGVAIEARFSPARLSLLERGIVFAIAHIRGGGELGRGGYEAGKLAHKANTFGDFERAAESLIAGGYTSSRRLLIRGGSAGGLLIGAVLNRRPELFHAALAEVPFVDVVNTMLDASLPLTVIEYEEWGNPASPEVLARLLGYSPYDNVKEQAYPHLLVTAGFNDPRVMYWEPAKWVARLRAHKRDANLLLLRMDMGSGHGGASGRYDAFREEAVKLAFLIEVLGRERQDGAAG
jgi:oligopeptidase B